MCNVVWCRNSHIPSNFGLKYTLSVLMLVVLCFCQAPDTLWSKILGGSNDDIGYCVRETSDLGYIIAGTTFSYGPGTPDSSNVYIVRTDMSGEIIWTEVYGGDFNDEAYSVRSTSDDGFIVVGYRDTLGTGVYEVWLLKLDYSGYATWTKTYGGTDIDIGREVEVTSDGGFVVVGETASFGAGGKDVWLLKCDVNGDTSWTKTYGTVNDEIGYSVKQTTDGGYIIAGKIYSTSELDWDMYLIKTDNTGEIEWTQVYGFQYEACGYSVDIGHNDSYVITGIANAYGGNNYAYTVNTDDMGYLDWERICGSLGAESYCVQTASAQGYVIAGYNIPLSGGLEFEIYIVRMDAEGDVQWSIFLNLSSEESAYHIQQTSDKGYIITGYVGSSKDIVLIRTQPDVVSVEELDNSDLLHCTSGFNVFPNPFTDYTELHLEMGDNTSAVHREHETMDISVYDVFGRKVRRLLVSQSCPCTWYGDDEHGQFLPSGVYFISLDDGHVRQSKKVIIRR
jgi:hypothetical protein